MDEENNISSDLSNQVKLGKDAAKTAKNLSKIAANAATGNAAGAALETAKAFRKQIIILACIPIFILFINIAFLYSLPTVIYEAAQSYVSDIQQEYERGVYESASAFTSKLEGIRAATTRIAEDVGGVIGKLWTRLKGKDTDDTESLTDDGGELLVAQVEEKEKKELTHKIEVAIKKTDNRMDQLEDNINAAKTDQVYNYYSKVFDIEYSDLDDDKTYVYTGAEMTVSKSSMTSSDASLLLSLYTVQKGGNVRDQEYLDFAKWLAYPDDSLVMERTNFYIDGSLLPDKLSFSVHSLDGDYLPQYLEEQKKNDQIRAGILKDIKEEELTASQKAKKKKIDDYYRQYSCAAVDMLVYVDCDLTGPGYYRAHEHDVYDPETKEYLYTEVSYTVTAYIKCRSTSLLTEATGLWAGSLNGDGQTITDPNRNADGFRNDLPTGAGNIGDFGTGTLAWPVPGVTSITSDFGYRIHPILKKQKLHAGMDIGCREGTQVIAAADGTVIKREHQYNGNNGTGYGNYLLIDHGGGMYTRYAHLSRPLAEVGQTVKKGDIIALSGQTGGVTGPHLHFEVIINGTPVDPKQYVGV